MTSATARTAPGRIELGWLLAGLGSLLLLVSLFLDWFEPGLTGWDVFESLDLVLAAASLAALSVGARSLGVMGLGETAGVTASVVAFVVVVSQLINHPPDATGLDIDTGGWLGLAGATLMLLGAAMSRAGLSLALVRHGEPGAAADATPSPRPAPSEGETVPMRPEHPR